MIRPGGTDALISWSSTATRGVTGPRRPLGGLGGFGSLAFSIPLGLSAGRPFSPLSRAISVRWAATVFSSAATLPSSSRTSAFSLVGERASRSLGEAILPGNQRQARQGSENRAAATGSAAVTQDRTKSLNLLATPAGLEPATYCLEVSCSVLMHQVRSCRILVHRPPE